MLRLASAAAWRVRLTEAGLESSEAFEAWLAEDAVNEAAWRQVAAPWNLLGEHAATPEVMQARHDALARAAAHGRIATREQSVARRVYRLSALAAGVVVVVAGMLWLVARPTEYRTAFGERRVVTLEDGSKVSLDSDTTVQVRYSTDARHLKLLMGQARFDVAHHTQRPFSVDAGDRTVIATGTSFNIDLRESEVVVNPDRGACPGDFTRFADAVADGRSAGRNCAPARRRRDSHRCDGHCANAPHREGESRYGYLLGERAPVQVQARTFSFNIPSAPLSKALRDYGEATGQQIIFTEDLVAGRRAPALQGTFDADDALRRLLEGSDLVMERTPAGAIMIVRSDQAAKSAQAAAQTADAAMLIEEIIVTATKREEPVRKISGSVTASDQAGLDAVGAESFADYLTRTPGVVFNQSIPAVRGVFDYRQDGGYTDNAGMGRDNVNGTEVRGGRILATLAPAAGTTINYLFLQQTQDTDDAGFVEPAVGRYAKSTALPERFSYRTRIHNLRLDQEFSFATLTATAARHEKKFSGTQDFSNLLPPSLAPAAFLEPGISEGNTFEVRLASPFGQRFEYLVGAFHDSTDEKIVNQLVAPNAAAAFGDALLLDAAVNIEAKESALFGEATWHFTDQFKATLGGRYFETRLTTVIAQSGSLVGASSTTRGESSENGFSPKASRPGRPATTF